MPDNTLDRADCAEGVGRERGQGENPGELPDPAQKVLLARQRLVGRHDQGGGSPGPVEGGAAPDGLAKSLGLLRVRGAAQPVLDVCRRDVARPAEDDAPLALEGRVPALDGRPSVQLRHYPRRPLLRKAPVGGRGTACALSGARRTIRGARVSVGRPVRPISLEREDGAEHLPARLQVAAQFGEAVRAARVGQKPVYHRAEVFLRHHKPERVP
jgi:hypothetical protein